jgi:serine/threonine protein kinase/tetratricopeptide (TPR) repeat protein
MSQGEQGGETFDETGWAGTPVDESSDAAASERPRTGEVGVFDRHGQPVRIEHFTLLERIGMGGMGELYLAYDERLDRKVALKLVRAGRRRDAADDRLLREAQTLAKISHPNVVTVFEAGAVSGRVYVAMEFVRGQTLGAWLKDTARLPERQRIREILRRFVDAGRGLAAVHEAGLAHRDFKPDNVLVGVDGRVRIVDFGLARVAVAGEEAIPVMLPEGESSKIFVSETGRSPSTLTATGVVRGTPRYMAPEQWDGLRGDARSDQFSFCVALFDALWRQWPFEGKDASELALAVTQGDLRAPPRNPEIPAALRAVVLRGLATDSDRRFASVGDLLARLEPFIAPRRRWIPLALGLSFVLLASLVLLALRADDSSALVRAWLSRWQREQIAAQHLGALEQRVAALVGEGRHAEADEAFAAFAELPEHAGTHALTRGWLSQADRLRGRGEHEAELAALATAHVESPGSEQEVALMGLARAFARERNHDQLAATLETLAELGLPSSPEFATEIATLRIQAAAARCDFVGARALLDEQGDEAQRLALGPALDELGRFTATHLSAAGPRGDGRSTPVVRPVSDLDGDGRRELILQRERDTLPVILAAEPTLPELQTLELPGEPDEFFAPLASTGTNLLGMRSGSDYSLLELIADGTKARVETRHRWTGSWGAHWAIGDLDGRPGSEVYVGHVAGRRMLGLRRDRGTWQGYAPHPPTDATASAVRGVAVGDIDGDGKDELVVVASEWAAYDVRILQPSPTQGDRLDLVARHKLGTIAALALLPDPVGPGMRIVVSVNHEYPSRQMFTSEAPGGEPEGFYQLSWRGRGRPIERVAHVPGHGGWFGFTGDFDGNGHVDYAAGLDLPNAGALVGHGPAATLVWLAQPDGSFAELILRRMWPIGAAELDGDDDDELIVLRDDHQRGSWLRGPVSVLGTGDARPPTTEPITTRAQAAPERLDAALDRTWQRAEQLAAIGLTVQAGETLGKLAQVADPRTAGRARRRAAEFAEQSGRLLEAARLYEQAGLPDALERAVELYDRRHAFADALRAAESLAEHPELPSHARIRWRARANEQHALAHPSSRRVFEFDRPLDGTWRIAADLAVRRESGGLRVDTLSTPGRHVLARWPVVPTGEPITIEVELDLLRVEWGASLGFELHPIDEPELDDYTRFERHALLSITASGGGSAYRLMPRGFNAEPGSRGLPIEHPSAEPALDRRRYRLGASLVSDRNTMWTSIEGPGVSAHSFHGHEPIAPGRYELRMVGALPPMIARGTFWIDRIITSGLVDDPEAEPLDGPERIRLALANDAPEQALRWLDDPSTSAADRRAIEFLRMLVLDELGRWSEVEPAFEHAIDHCAATPETEAWMALVLVLQPDRFGPTLRRLCPPGRFHAQLWAALGLSIHAHPELDDVHRTLTTQLIDLDTEGIHDVREASLVMQLLRARARGWQQQNAKAAARADLGQAIALAKRLLDEAELEQDPLVLAELRRSLAASHLALAVALVEQGNEDAALAELDQAIEYSQAPEITADRIVVEPEFAGLREREDWLAGVERVRAGLARGR